MVPYWNSWITYIFLRFALRKKKIPFFFNSFFFRLSNLLLLLFLRLELSVYFFVVVDSFICAYSEEIYLLSSYIGSLRIQNFCYCILLPITSNLTTGILFSIFFFFFLNFSLALSCNFTGTNLLFLSIWSAIVDSVLCWYKCVVSFYLFSFASQNILYLNFCTQFCVNIFLSY